MTLAMGMQLSLFAPAIAKSEQNTVTHTTLPEYARAIIGNYASRGYFINNALNDMIDAGIPGLEGPVFYTTIYEGTDDLQLSRDYRYILHLNQALEMLPAYTKEVYRGIYTSDPKRAEKTFKRGRVWKERRFSSSTTDKKVAEAFSRGAYKNEGCGGCSQSVEKPKSKNMIFLTIQSLKGRDISLWAKDGEKEVLFKSGTIYKVLSASRDSKGRFFAKLQELDENQLSDQDRAALQQSEEQRNKDIITEYGSSSSEDQYADGLQKFQAQMEIFNAAHVRWRSSGVLNTAIDFEAEAAEGGD